MQTKNFSGRKWGWLLLCCGVMVLQGCATKPPQEHSTTPVKPTPAAVALPAENAPAPASALPPAPGPEPEEPASTQVPLVQPLSTQRGVASWYGKEFHGRRTASGELFDAYSLTAAHRTLPIPSLARVRHVASGRTVIVRVNDRGPFHSNRVLDLSHAAAIELDMVDAGSAQVVIEALPMEFAHMSAEPAGLSVPENQGGFALVSDSALSPSPAPAEMITPARAYTPAARGFWVQLANVPKRGLAEQLQRRVSAQWAGLGPLITVFNEARMFQLQAGPYPSREQAAGVARWLQINMDLSPALVQRR